METADTPRYLAGDNSRESLNEVLTDDQLRNLIEELILSSKDLNLRVWLDGVYTDIDDDQVRVDWMNGREVYFKVEGSVDKLKPRARR